MSQQPSAQVQPIPHSLNHLIELNVEYGVLICMGNGCRCAVSPASISGHLRRKHHVRLEIRRQVDRYLEGFPFQYSYSDVKLPPDGLAPQPIIRVVDALQCKHCQTKSGRSQNRKAIREHCNKQHEKRRVPDEELFYSVRAQSWFWEGKERYWIVDESKQPIQASQPSQSVINDSTQSNDGQDDESQDENDDQEGVDDQIERNIKQWKVEAKERRLTLLKKAPADEVDPWLRYTQWNEVLSQSKHNFIKTHHFTREPNTDEQHLARVLRAWRRILDRCLDTLAASDHQDTLKWWASPKNEIASQRPFELPQNARTIEKYSGIYQHFLCYVLRTTPLAWGDESETGVVYTERQWAMIDHIRTILQTEPPEDEFTDEKEQDQDLTTAVMQFCMLVVMQDMSKITVYESPLMHFLAVMGVDTQSQTLRSSFYYTPILAGVLYINRLIMLEVAVPTEPWPMLQSRDEISSVPERIEKIRKKHLCEGSFSPTSSILSQLAMGKSFNKLHKSAPNIHWSEDEQTIFYQGQGVELGKFKMMCQVLQKELRAMLNELMFGPMPDINLSQIVDSMAWSSEFRRDDYSFIQHPKNQGIVDAGYQVLLRRARKMRGEYQMLRKGVDGQDEWIDHRVDMYLKQEKAFLRKAMPTIHVEYGQPARGPELGSVKVSNSIYSARNIYVINGRLCILSTYDKARKRRGNIEYIVRFLPDELSQIMVQYLVRVRPFARALDRRESEYLFADIRGPWAGEELTYALGPITDKHLGVRLTTSAYRQVAVGIATRHLIRASKTWEKDEEAVEEQFAEGDDDQELDEATFQHIMIRQAGHGTRVAQNHYAIDAAFLHRLGPELLSVYERASIAWHGLFDLKSDGVAKQESISIGHRREASQQIVPGSQKKVKVAIKQEKESASTKAIAGLRRIFGPNAQAQSEGQAAALELVHDPPRTCIIVLPTSSGKSALFFSVAAMVEQQTVIVVVPFAALVDDIIDRGQQVGLDCEEWLSEESGGEMRQLVVVSADRAVSEGFGHYAKGLELNGRLAHMFFDEAHVAFTDTSYRERLRDLWKLRYLNCPFTCLTATLIIQLEDVLRDRLLIPDACMFRRSTARRTIRYRVYDCGNDAPSTYGLKIIQGLGLPIGKRGVVYVRSYGTGDVVSTALKCPFYKARAEHKGELLQQWIQGPGGWIVATGALGTGININGIVFIVHIDRPYGLTSFAQQSGRGGRSGEVSDSIVVVRAKSTSGRRPKEILSAYCVEDVDEGAMTEFLQSQGCRRQVMATYFDGESKGVDCRATDSILCDRCSAKVVGKSNVEKHRTVHTHNRDTDVDAKKDDEIPGSQLVAARLRKMVEANERVIQAMDEFKRGCVFCKLIRIDGGAFEEPHTFRNCILAREMQSGYRDFQQWREGIEFGEDFMHCFECGLSQQICRRIENGSVCEYGDVMLPGIFILQQQGFLDSIVQRVGFQGDYPTDLWGWMRGVSEGFGSVVESCFMHTWREVCDTYLEMCKEVRSGATC